MTDQPATGEVFAEGMAGERDSSAVLLETPAVGAGRLRLDDSGRVRLGAFADCLIAGGAGLPSASAIEVHRTWIDRAVAARPDLVAVVEAVVAQEGEPQAVLDRLRRADAQAFGDFSFVVAGAYLIHPRVRKLLGYPAGAPAKNPALEGEAESYLEDGILDAVTDRGPIYRPTPAG